MPSLLVFLISILALWAPGAAQALPFNFEMRELRPEINPFARDVYGCFDCSLAQFDAIVPPAGWEKAAARVGLWSSGVFSTPPLPPGVAPSQDFVPEIPGDEFVYLARVLSASLLGFDPTLGPMALAQVQRNTVHTFDAGTVVHEVIDTAGERYVLFTFDHALSESTYDLSAVGSLAGLALPAGWTYESRVLAEALVIDSEGLANVFAQGGVASYQRYSVPEPQAALLVALAGGTAWCARRRRAR